MKVKGLRLIALMAIMMLLVSTMPCAMADTSAAIRAGAKVYQSASTSAKSVVVTKQMSVKLSAIHKGWARVASGKTTGYVPTKGLILREPITAYATKTAAVYKSASTSSKKLATFAKGMPFKVSGFSGSFAQVTDKLGRKGYISASALTSAKPTLTSSTKVDLLLGVAKSLMGTPYKTMDCSTFTAYCFSQVGISISSGIRYQGYMTQYPKVFSVKNLKRGDLVFFNTVDDQDMTDHAGIYIGNGQFVHSSSAAGKVITSTITSGYYNRKFSWGMRLIQ